MNGTKEKIEEAFKRLVCKKSFQKITISDIAKECAMTRENFYYHFRDKFDIMEWIYETEIVSQLPSDEEPFEEWLRMFLQLTCHNYKYYRKIIKGLGVEEARKVIYPFFEHRIRVLIQVTLDESVWSRRQEREEFAVRFFTDSFIGFFLNYYNDHEEIDEKTCERNIEFLLEYFLTFVRNENEDNIVITG